MTILAIDLTYQPVGGALAQIKEIIINVNSYKFDKVFFYLTKDNAYLFDGKMSKIIITNTVPFSNNSSKFLSLSKLTIGKLSSSKGPAFILLSSFI